MNLPMKISKKVITEVTFRECISEPDDIRCIQLKYTSEGAGRHFVLSDGSHEGFSLYLHHPDDFKLMWETAKDLWEQGSIFAETEEW